MNSNKRTLLKLDSLTKSFGGICVLDTVSLEIHEGEVHCILGENGAGKSTLIKIISGAYKADFGSIYLNDEKIEIKNSKIARDYGIGTVYQETSLVPTLDAVTNIFLGEEIYKKGMIKGKFLLDLEEMNRRALETFKWMDVEIKLNIPVKYLTSAEQQLVEIAKAITFDNKIIIMDEPTSSLSGKEVRELFRIIEQLKTKDVSIIFISHKLDEIEEISDRVTVLRDGKYIDTVRFKETNIENLINMMVGREFDAKRRSVPRALDNEIVLEARNIVSADGKVNNVSFELPKGIILGFAGLVGAGRTELMKIIFGKNKKIQGQLFFNGKEIVEMTTDKAVGLGISYLTEDRKREGLILTDPIRKNTTLAKLDRLKKNRRFLNLEKEKNLVKEKVDELNIVTTSIEKEAMYLSGGNQQKVVVAKWLFTEGNILIFDEPTRGIDVGARSEIYNIMNRLVDDGNTIIMVSSDLPEILSMSNRIVVMNSGKVTAILDNHENLTQNDVMKYMLNEMET
jgi:ribose transport system ATP-binding protein